MIRNLWCAVACLGGLLALTGSAAAHHAGANYDREHLITLSGTVTEFLFTNPHAQIVFEVKGSDGTVTKWVGVGDPPQRLYKVGWTKTSIKVGDQITVIGGPRVDGSKELDIRDDQLTVNGKKLSQKD